MASKGIYKLAMNTPEHTKMQSGMRKLQQTINFEQKLCAHENCNCLICHGGYTQAKIKPYTSKYEKQQGKDTNWIRKILNGLTPMAMPTLKIFIPDFCFMDGDLAEVFFTDYSNNRIKKDPGTTPIKMLFSKMLRMRKNYKSMLQQGFRRSILDKIDPHLIHQKYMQQILPTHFNNGQQSMRLMSNRSCFKKYIFHQNPNYIISSIQEHKINENEPFCSVKYNDSNVQLFSQKQFQTFMVMKIPNDIFFIESYIKEKQQSKSMFTTQYNFYDQLTHPDLFSKAQMEVLVMIGGIDKYSEVYEDLEVLEDSANELMKDSPQLYCYYTCFRVIHYLGMVSRIYVKHLKINWLMNDMGTIYMHDVFEFQTCDVSLRKLKFRMPPRQHNLDLDRDAETFTTIYKQLQKAKNIKVQKIKEQIKNKFLQIVSLEQTIPITIRVKDPLLLLQLNQFQAILQDWAHQILKLKDHLLANLHL